MTASAKTTLLRLVAALPLLICLEVSRGQVTFYSDMFNGGVLTGGFSVGTVGQGSGSFNMPVPPGATIHRAYFFATQVGTATPPVVVQLNGGPYLFDASNFVGPVFQSPFFGGDAGVHAIDVTADLSAAATNYTITVPAQVNSVSNVYTEFYLLIAYDLVGAQSVNVEVYFSDQDSQQTLNYTLNTAAPMLNTSPIGFCVLGGYAACCTDCETVTANGTNLGSWFGGDFNSADPGEGSMGAMEYTGGVLTGLGDDNADQPINATDVVSDLSGLVINDATSLNVQFDHCAGGSAVDNHVWLMVLAYTSDQCDITLNLGPDTAFCAGGSIFLDATQAVFANYTWQDGANTAMYNVFQTGDYYVHVNTPQCDRYDTVHVDVNALPVFDLGNDTIVCAGFSLTLDATSVPAGTVTWQDGTTNTTFTATTGGAFWATVDNVGCAVTDTVLITALPIPQAVLPAQIDLCQGDSVTLNSGNATSSHLWSTGDTTQSITVDSTGTYSVIVTNAGSCSTMDTAQVTIHLPPVVQLGPDTSLCLGEQWTMDAGNSGSAFTWNTGAHTQVLTISTSQVMWVHVTSAAGCTGGDTISVTFDPIPVIDLQDDSVCVSQSVTLDAGNPGAYYHWNTGATTQSITVSGTGGTSDTYSVVVTSPTFCTDSAQATITYIDFPVADLGPDTALCVHDVLTIFANAPGMALTWSNGTHNGSVDVQYDGTIWLDVSNGFCTSRDSMNVVFNPLPDPIQVSTRIACLAYPPNMTPLDAGNAGSTFLWNTHDTTQVLQATAYGHYTVTITTPEHCVRTDTIEVLEYCPPQLWVPNSFTPDGDGVNDVFGPNGYNIATIDLSIYDRWGELIHAGEGTNANWDGSTGSTKAMDGVYVWKVHYRNVEDAQGSIGSVQEAIGHVTLLR